jgi:hypothetical protein
MREIFRIFVLAALGGIVGNVTYVHTHGDGANYHWVLSFATATLFTVGWVMLLKHRRENIPQ